MTAELISVGTEILLGNIVNTNAKYLAKLIEEKFGPKNFTYSYVGAVIGSHSGPGTLALF